MGLEDVLIEEVAKYFIEGFKELCNIYEWPGRPATTYYLTDEIRQKFNATEPHVNALSGVGFAFGAEHYARGRREVGILALLPLEKLVRHAINERFKYGGEDRSIADWSIQVLDGIRSDSAKSLAELGAASEALLRFVEKNPGIFRNSIFPNYGSFSAMYDHVLKGVPPQEVSERSSKFIRATFRGFFVTSTMFQHTDLGGSLNALALNVQNRKTTPTLIKQAVGSIEKILNDGGSRFSNNKAVTESLVTMTRTRAARRDNKYWPVPSLLVVKQKRLNRYKSFLRAQAKQTELLDTSLGLTPRVPILLDFFVDSNEKLRNLCLCLNRKEGRVDRFRYQPPRIRNEEKILKKHCRKYSII